MAQPIHLVRDVLDKQMIDTKRTPMGRVDGIVLDLRADDAGRRQQPRVTQIENGFPVLARRIHPRLRRWAAALGWRFGIRRGATYRIPIAHVLDVGREIQLKRVAEGTPILEWERVLRRRVIGKIPGSGR
jgi:hypothetical protein